MHLAARVPQVRPWPSAHPLLQLKGLELGGLGGAFPLGLRSRKCSPSSGCGSWQDCSSRGDP